MSITKQVLFMGEVGEFEFEVASEGVNIYTDGCFIDNKKFEEKVNKENLLIFIKHIIESWNAVML